MRDFRYTLRTLLKNPGFSLAAVLVLALGIGANTAIFSVIRAVLLAPLPYPHPERLVNLYERDVVGTTNFNVVSGANVLDWQRDAQSFEQMAFYGEWGSSFAPDDGGLPENIDAAICSDNLIATLGIQPAMGRWFSAEENAHGGPRVAVISDGLWKQRFGARAGVVGRQARFDGELHTIVGVMPEGFGYPKAGIGVWLPVWQNTSENARRQRGNHRFNVVARLKPGVTVEQARSEIDGIARRIKRDNPEILTGKGGNAVRTDEQLVARVRPTLLVLLGAVACVLLIACVNVTNLLLARAVSRKREVAVRVAIGASRGRIIQQFLTESSMLAFTGAALGLAIAALGTRVLVKMAGYLPRVEEIQLNGSVLAFTAAIAIGVGIAVGLAPAVTSWRAGLTSAMQEGGRAATAGRARALFRDGLVAIEVALSLMLLIGAGLMIKSFLKLQSVDPGFNPERMLSLQFSLSPKLKAPQVAGFYRDLLEQVRTQPGVESAGIVTVAPLRGHFMDNTFTIDGHPPLPNGQFLDAVVRSADPGYFQAAGIPVKRGRVFSDADRLETCDKAVITEGMAARFFPHEDPMGKRLRTSSQTSYEIVGIVGDTRQNLAQRPEPMMYFPLYCGDMNFASLLVRASGDPNLLSLPVQKSMRGLNTDLPAVTVKTMDQLMASSTQPNRFGLTLIALFAGLAVVLASIGLYGVLAYAVSQRTNEFGVRIALGADSSRITKLVLWQGMMPASIGIVIGLLGGLAATRLLQSMLFDVSPNDPAVIAMVALLIAVVAMAASLAPAWRATRIDPVIALRAE